MRLIAVLSQTIAIAVLECSIAATAGIADALPLLLDRSFDPFESRQKAANLVAPELKPDSCSALPDTKRKLSFNEIVVATLCHNPQTKASYLSLVGQAASYVANYSGYLPTVSSSYSRSRSTAFGPGTKSTSIPASSSMSLSMTLYDFGQREFRLETAELSLVSAGHSFNSTLQGAISSALRAYYNLLNAQNAVGVAAKSETFARESYEAAKLRHEIGQVPLADELQARVSYAGAQLGVQQAENNLLQQQAAIAILMGMKPDTKVVVEEVKEKSLAKDPFVAELKTLMEVAKEKRQDLQARRASLRGSEISLEAQKRANLATLSVTTNMSVSNDTAHLFNNKKSRSQAVGFVVSIPIFSGFNRLYSQQASETSLEAQRESLVGTELSIVQDVWNSWHNYETAKRSWRTSKEQLANAINLKDVALARYKEGLGTILDVLNAQLQYTSALQSNLQSRYSLLTSRVDVVRAVGTLDMDTMQPETTTNLSPRAELSQER